MFLLVHMMFNPSFQGDNQQIIGIQQQLVQKLDQSQHPHRLFEYEDSENIETLTKKLGDNLTEDGQHVLIVSGSHGNDLLKNEAIKNIITNKKIQVIWVGHQDPGLVINQAVLHIVALPIYIVETNPVLHQVFKERLVPLEAVPNTLKEAELTSALGTWNNQYPNDTIPLSQDGYIGVFLGGDAPKPAPDKAHLYWDEKDAFDKGKFFGGLALEQNKFLLVTNGPRTGKFYPESPNPKAPVVRHYNDGHWVALEQLSEEKRKETNPNEHSIAHTKDAPLDPVSLAFIQGIQESGLKESQYKFLDFKFGKSAYRAVISALFLKKDKSIACYSGESTSYSEITYFIPYTYAFLISSMNEGHKFGIKHFQRKGTVSLLNYDKPLQEQPIDLSEKARVLVNGSNQDAEAIVGFFFKSNSPQLSPGNVSKKRIDPSSSFDSLKQLLNNETSYAEYKKILEMCTPEQMRSWMVITQTTPPFISMFHLNDDIAIMKMKVLFEHTKRLGINPNASFNPQQISLPSHVNWNNTSLHYYIANERYRLVGPFLENARINYCDIDLNIKDREGKTAFMFAVKMSNCPFEVVKSLITSGNYNTSDNEGITPIMMASAMRRVDIIKLILQQEAERLGLGVLDFEHLTPQQKAKLDPFVNYQHPTTQKSLAHFAVLRGGVESELEKPDSYQQTVINIAKSVGIDARRDENARANAPTNDTGAQVIMSSEERIFFNKNIQNANDVQKRGLLTYAGLKEDFNQLGMVFSLLSYRGDEKIEHALLASKQNAFQLVIKTTGENKAIYTKLLAQVKSYSGVTHLASILKRTEETVRFLYSIGANFTLKQTQGNKSPGDYITALKDPKNKNLVSKEEIAHLFPMLEIIKSFIAEKPVNNPLVLQYEQQKLAAQKNTKTEGLCQEQALVSVSGAKI